MISVIIPLYNKIKTVSRTIESVLNQSYTNFELIVVDDGSDDGSETIVKKYNDIRIRYIRQANGGVSRARNHGIAESKGNYIAFLDADDIWYPGHLESNIKLTEKYPQCKIFASTYNKSDANGTVQKIKLYRIPDDTDFIMDNYFEVAAVSDPPIHTGSVMITADAIKNIGGFPEGVAQGEDLLTWARLAVKNKIAYNTIPQSVFFTGEQSRWDTPKRTPPQDDIVGYELEKMHYEHPEVTGMIQYISLWHKMRASIYLRLPGEASKCRKEVHQSQRWHRNKKLYYYLIISYIPYSLRMRLLKIIK